MICNKNCQSMFHEKLKIPFFNAYKFCKHDSNKFILLLRKVVYPYKYMDDWEKFKQASLPKRNNFYSHLNKQDITDADYAYAKRDCKDFEIKKYRRILRFVCSKQYIIVK